MLELYYKNSVYVTADGITHTHKDYYLLINGRYVPISQRYYKGEDFLKINQTNSIYLELFAKPLQEKEIK